MTNATKAALRAQLFQIRTSPRLSISTRCVCFSDRLADTQGAAVTQVRRMLRDGEFERVRIVNVVARYGDDAGSVCGFYIVGRGGLFGRPRQ